MSYLDTNESTAWAKCGYVVKFSFKMRKCDLFKPSKQSHNSELAILCVDTVGKEGQTTDVGNSQMTSTSNALRCMQFSLFSHKGSCICYNWFAS